MSSIQCSKLLLMASPKSPAVATSDWIGVALRQGCSGTYLFISIRAERVYGWSCNLRSVSIKFICIEPGDPPEFPKPCVYLAPNRSRCLLHKVRYENYLTLPYLSLGDENPKRTTKRGHSHTEPVSSRGKTSKPLSDCIMESLCHISDIGMKGQTQIKMPPAL